MNETQALYQPQIGSHGQSQCSGFSILFEGHEYMRNLTFAFPLPYPGIGGGPISFYETHKGHTFDFLKAVDGKELSARIESNDGKLVFAIPTARISISAPLASWVVDGPLKVHGTIVWHEKDVIRVTNA